MVRVLSNYGSIDNFSPLFSGQGIVFGLVDSVLIVVVTFIED